MNKRKKVVVIIAPSGTGKTYLVNKLKNTDNKYGIAFKIPQQVTTRKMRVGESQGNPYIFFDRLDYEEIKYKLTAKVASQFGKDHYGTLVDQLSEKENEISLIIASEEGLLDLKKDINKYNINLFVIGLSNDGVTL